MKRYASWTAASAGVVMRQLVPPSLLMPYQEPRILQADYIHSANQHCIMTK